MPHVPRRSRTSTEDTARRVLEALHRSAARARRVAAQTGTRIVVACDGGLVVGSAGGSPRSGAGLG